MQQSTSSNYIQEFKLSFTQGQIDLLDSWLDVLTFLWNRELSIKLWVDYQESLNRCRFYPGIEKKDATVIPLPIATLTEWGFQNIALAKILIKTVSEEKREYSSFVTNCTEFVEVLEEDYPEIKLGKCRKEVFLKNGSHREYIVYSGLTGLKQGQFIVCYKVKDTKKNTKKDTKVFELHSPLAKTEDTKKRKVNIKEEIKVYSLATERTTYTKVSLNDYPAIKSGECHREEFPKQGNQPGYVVFTGLPGLHENQFILQLNTSKGIVFQLHSVATWANQKAHYLKPCVIGTELISRQYHSQKANNQAVVKADRFVPENIKDIYFGSKKGSVGLCSRMYGAQSHALQLSWELYREGKKGCPRFKTKSDRIKTLINSNAKGKVKVLDGDRIRLPKIPFALKVKGLNKRYNGDLIVGFKITKKASGYYLQLTLQGDRTPRKIKIRENEIDRKVVGIDAGAVCLFADSEGHIFSSKPRRHEVVRAKRLRRLQRKLSRQKLKSNNWKKTQHKLALTHEKIARQRRSRDHYHSTVLVREYDAIAVEDLNLGGMTKASKTKVEVNEKTGKLEYAKVKRKQKSGLNKALLRNTPGQRHALIESKAKMADREFCKIKAAYSSQECYRCGHISANNRPSQAIFKCEKCGHEDHADKNAAKVIRDRGLKAFSRSYPAYTGKVTPVEISASTPTLLSGGGAQEPSNGIQESNSPEIASTLTNSATLRRSRKRTSKKTAETLTDKADCGNQKPEPIRAKPEPLAPPDFGDKKLKATLPLVPPQNQKRKRSAQNPDPNRLTLDL